MEPGLLKSADWPLLIDLYFFLGGVAGGAFVLATVAALVDDRRYRDLMRVGYYVALLAIIPAPIFLIVDLGLPSRFLNMLMVTKPSTDIGMQAFTAGPFHLKLLSPMSAGAWALMLFSACAFLAALMTFLEDRSNRRFGISRLAVGLVGQHLRVLHRRVSRCPPGSHGPAAVHQLPLARRAVPRRGGATGAAMIVLVLALFGGERRDALAALMRALAVALIVQAIALVLFIVTVWMSGSVGIRQALAHLLSGQYSLTFWLGAVLVGLVVPLALQFAAGGLRRASAGITALVAILVLVGGFVIKYVMIAAGQVT